MVLANGVIMQPNTDAAIACLLVGPAVAQRMYSCSQTAIEEQLCNLPFCSSLFLLRLRTLLKQCCASLGLEATCQKLQLPTEIAYYIKTGAVMKNDLSREEISSAVLKAETARLEEKREGGELIITPEQRRLCVDLYMHAVKLPYIAGLFGIVNPSVIHSWGDWRMLPPAEARKKIDRRRMIQARLDRGESPQSIRVALRIKDRVYRQLMGVPIGILFPYSAYENVMKQMAAVNFRRLVSRNTGVPLYFIRRWMEGIDIPERPLIESDEEGSADTKKQAIIKFYETANASIAAHSAGVASPQTVERWVCNYQRAVDDRPGSDN